MEIYLGKMICDHRYKHLRIVEIIDEYTVLLEDGSIEEIGQYVDDVPHAWIHPVDSGEQPQVDDNVII